MAARMACQLIVRIAITIARSPAKTKVLFFAMEGAAKFCLRPGRRVYFAKRLLFLLVSSKEKLRRALIALSFGMWQKKLLIPKRINRIGDGGADGLPADRENRNNDCQKSGKNKGLPAYFNLISKVSQPGRHGKPGQRPGECVRK